MDDYISDQSDETIPDFEVSDEAFPGLSTLHVSKPGVWGEAGLNSSKVCNSTSSLQLPPWYSFISYVQEDECFHMVLLVCSSSFECTFWMVTYIHSLVPSPTALQGT